MSYNTDNTQLETKNGIVYKGGKTFTGHLFTLNANGRDTLFSGFYNEGKQDGIVKKWYDDGSIMEIRYYKENMKAGTHSGFWPNGNRKFIYHFEDGGYAGIQHKWFESGNKYQQKTYEDGQEKGLQREWNDSGILTINYEARNGRQYGNIGKKNCASVWREDVYSKPSK